MLADHQNVSQSSLTTAYLLPLGIFPNNGPDQTSDELIWCLVCLNLIEPFNHNSEERHIARHLVEQEPVAVSEWGTRYDGSLMPENKRV